MIRILLHPTRIFLPFVALFLLNPAAVTAQTTDGSDGNIGSAIAGGYGGLFAGGITAIGLVHTFRFVNVDLPMIPVAGAGILGGAIGGAVIGADDSEQIEDLLIRGGIGMAGGGLLGTLIGTACDCNKFQWTLAGAALGLIAGEVIGEAMEDDEAPIPNQLRRRPLLNFKLRF